MAGGLSAEMELSPVTAVFPTGCIARRFRLTLRAGFVHDEVMAIQRKAVQSCDSSFRFLRSRHLYEGEATRLKGVTIFDDRYGHDRSVNDKEIFQLLFSGRGIQVANEDVDHNCFPKIAHPQFSAGVGKRAGKKGGAAKSLV